MFGAKAAALGVDGGVEGQPTAAVDLLWMGEKPQAPEERTAVPLPRSPLLVVVVPDQPPGGDNIPHRPVPAIGSHRVSRGSRGRRQELDPPFGRLQLLGEAGGTQRHGPHRKQREFRGQYGREPLLHLAGIHRRSELQVEPLPQAFGTEGEGKGQLKARQGMEAPCEAHRQGAAAQGPLQQT